MSEELKTITELKMLLNDGSFIQALSQSTLTRPPGAPSPLYVVERLDKLLKDGAFNKAVAEREVLAAGADSPAAFRITHVAEGVDYPYYLILFMINGKEYERRLSGEPTTRNSREGNWQQVRAIVIEIISEAIADLIFLDATNKAFFDTHFC